MELVEAKGGGGGAEWTCRDAAGKNSLRRILEGQDTIYQLTNSVDHIPKEILKECYQRFLNSFETYVGRKDPKSIDSKTTIQDFLREDLGLFRGNEIILHSLCTVAVKYSVQQEKNWKTMQKLIYKYYRLKALLSHSYHDMRYTLTSIARGQRSEHTRKCTYQVA